MVSKFRRFPHAMVAERSAAISMSGSDWNRLGNCTGSSAMNAGEFMRAASESRSSRSSFSVIMY